MSWERIKFGKYNKEMTLPQLLFFDPGYFFWAIQDNAFRNNKMMHEANELFDKACSVFPPASYDYDSKVEYYLRYEDYKFINFRIVPANRPVYAKVCNSIRKDVVDFRIVYESDPKDEEGYRIFLRTFKRYYFGDENYRLNREECERFFDTKENFERRKRPRREKNNMLLFP